MFKKLVPILFILTLAISFPLYGQDKEKSAEDLLKVLEETDKEVKQKTAEEAKEEVENEAASEEMKEQEPAAEKEEAKPEQEADLIEKVESARESGEEKENLLLSPAIYGQTGLFRIYSAQRPKPSITSFNVSMHMEWFKEKNFIAVGDTVSRFRGTAAFTYIPIKYMELFFATYGFTNTGKSSTTVLQRVGDFSAGIKGGYDFSDLVSIGANFIFEMLNGAGDVNVTSNAYNYDFNALLTLDFKKAMDFPLRLHANVGYRLDKTIEATGAAALAATERFFLDIMPQDQVTFGIGLEVPIDFVSMFLEYTSEQCMDFSYTTSPQRLTVGMKIFPTKEQNLSFDVGADIRLANTNRTARAIGVPDYNIIWGLTFANHAKPKEPPKVIPTTGKLQGKVIDAETNEPITDAIIEFYGKSHPTILSDKSDGTYFTGDLPQGIQNITVMKEGYEPLKITATVTPGEMTNLDLVLTKKRVVKGSVVFLIYDADDNPLKGSVKFMDFPKLKPYAVNTDKGGLKVKLKAGTYKVKMFANKFQPEEMDIEVVAGEENRVKNILREVVDKVVIKKDKIVIKDKIHFNSGKAEIRTDSLSLLNRVADLISDHEEVKKVRIEGYTDSVGAADFNLKLSQKRAESVMEYLVIRGIAQERVEAVGYGEANPIANNKTKQGRAINRRVEFTIINE